MRCSPPLCTFFFAVTLLAGFCLGTPSLLAVEPNLEIKMNVFEPDKEVVCRTLEDGLTLNFHFFLPPGHEKDDLRPAVGVEKVGKERKMEISPVHQVRSGLPPTLISHGTNDRTVAFENAERFTRLMNEAGNVCTLIPFPGKGHGFFNGSHFQPKNSDTDFEKTMHATREFLQTVGLNPTGAK